MKFSHYLVLCGIAAFALIGMSLLMGSDPGSCTPPPETPLCGTGTILYGDQCVPGCFDDFDCTAGEKCQQVYCFAEPCFPQCIADPCEPVDPNQWGACEMLMGAVWDGTQCLYASGCGCDDNCQGLFATLEECEAAIKVAECKPEPAGFCGINAEFYVTEEAAKKDGIPIAYAGQCLPCLFEDGECPADMHCEIVECAGAPAPDFFNCMLDGGPTYCMP